MIHSKSRTARLVFGCCLSIGTSLVAVPASAATWCVDPTAPTGCKATIGAAVAAASANDTILVAPGTYAESITIGMPLSLIGTDATKTIINAATLSWGIYVDGIDNAKLANVFISGFTVQNAQFEGILVANASAVTIANNIVDRKSIV